MPKQLLIVRHAKAVEFTGEGSDFERTLRKKGLHQSQLMGEQLAALGFKADKVYASPAARTKETAALLSQAIGYQVEDIIYDHFIYEADILTLLNVVNKFEANAEKIMIVGHNPSITFLADYLCGSSIGFMPTAGMSLAQLTVDNWAEASENTAELLWFKTPKML